MSRTPWLLAAPALGLLLAFFALPLLLLVRVSLLESPESGVGFYRPGTWTSRAYAELLGERFGRNIIAFTVLLGAGVASLSLLIGYPLALFIHSLPRRAKFLALGVVVLPKLANVFIVVYSLNLLLGSSGPVNRALVGLGLAHEPILLTHNLTGVVIAETFLILPYAILVLVPVFDRIDPNLTAAVRGLGAGPWRAFRRVTVPLSLPGVVVAGQLCLIWARARSWDRCCSAVPSRRLVGMGAASGDRVWRLAAGRGDGGVDHRHGRGVRSGLRLARASGTAFVIYLCGLPTTC